MRHTILLTIVLAAFWLLNSNHYTLFMLMLGGISTAVVLFLAHRMDITDHEHQPVHLSSKIPAYYLWLLKEVVVSNISVVKHIWIGNKSISPTLSTLKTRQKTDIGKVIYANSITLTPGTVTVDVVGDRLMVHSLLKEGMDVLQTGEMDRRVHQLES